MHREMWEMTATMSVCLVDACGQGRHHTVRSLQLPSKKFCVHGEENIG